MGEVISQYANSTPDVTSQEYIAEHLNSPILVEFMHLKQDELDIAEVAVSQIWASERGQIYAHDIASDQPLAEHSQQVAVIAAVLWMRYQSWFGGALSYGMEDFIEAGLVHDHGKRTVEVHGKPGVLSAEERLDMEEHVTKSALYALSKGASKNVVALVFAHHAHLPFNDTQHPYPTRDQLPFELKQIWDKHQSVDQNLAQAVFAMADIICAVTSSKRTYRKAVGNLQILIAILQASFSNPRYVAMLE